MQNVASVFLTLLMGLCKKWHILSVKSDSKALALKVNRKLVPFTNSTKIWGFPKPRLTRQPSGTQAHPRKCVIQMQVLFEIRGGRVSCGCSPEKSICVTCARSWAPISSTEKKRKVWIYFLSAAAAQSIKCLPSSVKRSTPALCQLDVGAHGYNLSTQQKSEMQSSSATY